MKRLPKLILTTALLVGISILVAQEASPAPDARPAAAPAIPTATANQRYDYEMVCVAIPLQPNLPSSTPERASILQAYSDWEIVDVTAARAPVRPRQGSTVTPPTREVLIYTLRKPRR